MAALIAVNLAIWALALAVFRHSPALLGTAAIAYGFGLRHAVDADHIAAIDNVTRKLLQQGSQATAVGLYFSLGHSTIVLAASAALALTAGHFQSRMESFRITGFMLGTAISALFLLGIAAANFTVFRSTWQQYRRVPGDALRDAAASRAPHTPAAAGPDDAEHRHDGAIAPPGGLFARCLHPAFRLISQSWQMYPLGVLFGLGFDTATEIGVLAISATEVSRGLPIWTIMVFPALFTAGMSLADTAEGLMMAGAYGWALRRPKRRLAYNLAITLLSVVVALGIGAIELLGLAQDQFHAHGMLWSAAAIANDHSSTIGMAVIMLFAGSWAVAAWRAQRRPADIS